MNAKAVISALAPKGDYPENRGDMSDDYLVTRAGKATIVEFQFPSLMEPRVLEAMEARLVKLVTEMDRRILILDFSRVEYLSSQAIGLIMTLNRKITALPHSKFILCSVNAKLLELIKITRLDRILTIKPTQKEAIAATTGIV